MRNRLPGEASVGRGADGLAEADGVRPREPARNELEAVRGRAAGDFGAEDFREAHRPAVGGGAARSVSARALDERPDARPLLAFEVGGDGGLERGERKRLLLHDTLLDRAEAVRHHGQPRAVDRHVVVGRAAVRDVHALFDRAVREEVEHQLRLVEILVREMEVDAARGDVHRGAEVPDVVFLEILRTLRLGERDLEDLGDVDLHDVVERVFEPGQAHPVATDGDAAARELGGVSAAHEALDERLVSGKARAALPVGEEYLHAAPEKAAVHAVPDADREVARRLELAGRFEDEVGERRRLVAAVRVRSADLVVVRVVEQEAEDEKLRVFVGENARGLVALVVGAQQLVELPAGAVAVVGARGHVEDRDPLHRLAEGAGRCVHDRVARARRLFEVGAARGVVLRHRAVVRRRGEVPDPGLHAEDRLLFGVEEFKRVGGVRRRGALRLHSRRLALPGEAKARFAHLREQPAPAEVEADLVVRGEMGVLADARRDVVFFLLRLQVRVVEGEVGARKLVSEAHPGKHEHPAPGDGVVGVDVARVVLHEPAEVRGPGSRAGPLARRVARRKLDLERRRGQDEPVVVLVARAERGELRLGLFDLARGEARHAGWVVEFVGCHVVADFGFQSFKRGTFSDFSCFTP